MPCKHVGAGVYTTREERINRFVDDQGKEHCIKTIEVKNFCRDCAEELGTKAWSEPC